MISPQGYSLGEEPKSTNPFWGNGEDGDVNMIFATGELQGQTGDGPASVQTSKTIDGHNITFGFLFKNIIGKNGVSPTVTVTNISGGHRVTITDATSTHTFDVMDGEQGEQGENGVSPDVSVREIVGGHIVTITDATGSESFTVMNGQDGGQGEQGPAGTTPEITITATQDGQPVTVTKTGSGATQNFEFALTGGGGSTGSLVGWGPELASTNNYPVIKNTKKSTSEAWSETGVELSGALNDDQWQAIYISGTCDLSIDAATVFNITSSVKMDANDSGNMSSWTTPGGFDIENLSITDNSEVWTLSDIQAEVQYISDTGTFVTGLSIKINCTATSGAVAKAVNGNVSVNFSNYIGYTTATTYQNLVVVGQ